MSEPYTDRFGYPLTSSEALRRVSHPKSRGYYRNGVWVRLQPRTAKRTPTEQKPKEQK